MSIRKASLSVAAAVLGVGVMGSKANAAFVSYFQQVGTSVVETGTGSINTAGVTAVFGPQTDGSIIEPASGVDLGGPASGPTGGVQLYRATFTGPSTFGTGGASLAPLGSGDQIGIDNFGTGSGYLYIPINYVSGAPLAYVDTFTNSTLGSLGITPGTYVDSFGAGATADTFTITTVAPVPEPASLAAIGIPAALGLLRRRRQTV